MAGDQEDEIHLIDHFETPTRQTLCPGSRQKNAAGALRPRRHIQEYNADLF
jgi:hypothetical protein